MSDSLAVSVSGLRVVFGRRVILPDVSLKVPAGSIVGLLGPSGSGKTTLVKALMGIHSAASGAVSIFGKPVPSFSAMTGVGYMAQQDALYEDLSATENLLFFARLFGLKGRPARRRAEELLDFVDLTAHAARAVKVFSGGMKRRLSLAIALMHRPRLLILDEPTVGIDPLLRKKFWDEFEALRSQGCTLLVTTHVLDEAAHCDSLLLLREGRILADGPLAGILSQSGTATLEEAFLALSRRDAGEAV